ncbi:RimJ/RimL family protein N-acetyltransferase [Solirubrobacter pauli]|uniref:RimJ/RimL family protein N-acetyltransferase n=1 Tax=Solirubrobacter pauli TaxID=166793 RepID=A0A660L627_9ACTN|nr:GNAT family N-acetyltransferase [Solirubrobacter pauli]RKQ88349.1 RimJ/RimL family protein N-acetyltransferase [Solirubrobacter pauli]
MALRYPSPALTDGAVTLRPWHDDDLACVEQAATDPRIPAGTTVPAVFTREAGLAFIERQRRRVEDGEGVSLAISADGRAVGLLWLGVRPQPEVVGVGYWVVPAARGRGFGARAVRLAAGWALDHVGVARLEAWVAPVNVPSQRLLVSAGFQLEGRLRKFLDGGRTDALVFSRVVEDEHRGTTTGVPVPRRELLRVVQDLNGIVVSLDRLGSAMAFDELEALAVAQYVEHGDVFARLAVARGVLADALSAELETGDERVALDEEISARSTYWPDVGEPVVLALSDGVRDVLQRVLERALEEKGGDVIDDIEWGDVRAFIDEVTDPLRDGRSAAGNLVVTPYEVPSILAVIDGVGESQAGGVAWYELDAVERYAVQRVLDRLGSRR